MHVTAKQGYNGFLSLFFYNNALAFFVVGFTLLV